MRESDNPPPGPIEREATVSRPPVRLAGEESVVSLHSDVIIRDLGNGVVLIHLGTNRIYETNATGGRFVTLLAEGRSLADIRAHLLEEFSVDEATLARETDDLLRLLADEGLLGGDTPGR